MDPLDLSGFEVATGREAREARLTVSLSGTNLERAGDYNQRIVLQAIRLARETTRQELSRITGLTAPTIANITRRLLDAGLAKSAGRLQGKRGQPAMRIAIDPDGGFGVGLNIDRDHVSMVIVDLAGEVRSRDTREIAFALPDMVVAYVRETLPKLIKAGRVDRKRILGVGVALPDDLGRIDLPHRPARYGEWDHVDIAALLGEALPWPIHTDNDAAAAALGESQLGESIRLPSYFYLLVSAGLGGGLVIDRTYFRGANSRSGEIWAMPDTRREGATVQDTVSLSALYARLEEAGLTAGSPADLAGGTPEMDAILDAWLDDAVRALIPPLTAVNCLINPAAVLIGGRLPGRLADALVERLNAAMAPLELPAVAPVRRAATADDAPAIGAAIIPFLDTVLPSEGILMQAGR
ncbi:MAG: ROK family protein [Sphingomonas sp.]